MDDRAPRTELVALVARIMSGDYNSESAQDEDVRRLQQAVPHPRVTDLMFLDERGLTPEQVVDEALSYRPFEL